MDMLTMAMKGMGIDPESIVAQAKQLGAAFESIVRTQALILENQATAQASLDMITSHLGLYVPPPAPEVMRLIESESARFFGAGQVSGPVNQ